MISCEEAAWLVSESLDRKLPLWQRFQLRFHNFLCKNCATYRRQVRELDQVTRECLKRLEDDGPLPAATLSAEARERIKKALCA